MHFQYNFFACILIGWGCLSLQSCSKLVQVPEPVNTITNVETFGSDATATAAVMGIYNDILTGHQTISGFGNCLVTLYAGMSADELHIYNGPSPFETNTLDAIDFPTNFWAAPYYDIYIANAAVEGLTSSTGVTSTTRNQLMGEAKFLRAFCYFYLVNFFGGVPLATTTEYKITDTLHRASQDQVYQLMISDLQDAKNLLPNDYSISGGQKIRVNQSGAAALLARVYLYHKDWAKAEAAASSVIGSNLFSLVQDLNGVFLANNSEAILQWLPENFYPYATIEGNSILPTANGLNPGYYLTNELLADFEAGDQRRLNWVDSVNYSGIEYYYPYKYKVYSGQQGNITEYFTVLRLAEQYLIRAEARAEQSNLPGAIDDLDTIRVRAGLPILTASSIQSQVLASIMQERRIEMFSEWGHRWLDLKRTGTADSVLSLIKAPNWISNHQLYPIPANEIIDDGNLSQNPDY